MLTTRCGAGWRDAECDSGECGCCAAADDCVNSCGLRWQVREAAGGAEAMAQLEASRPEAMLVDTWLPDLEVGEFAGLIRMMYPGMEVLQVDGGTDGWGAQSAAE